MKTNIKSKSIRPKLRTHEGAPAVEINAIKQLERTVLSCMLFENSFYESGVDTSSRIASLIKSINPHKVAEIAIRARNEQKLRHVPLFIVREMARLETHRPLVASTLEQVVQRADEPGEFLSLYWKDGKQPLANQVKKGLGAAFRKFDEYQLAKYANGAITPRDVLFMVHPKPENREQAALWKKLADKNLATPNTWEVRLSAAGSDVAEKKKVWLSLLKENELRSLALLRNLRNMLEVGVDIDIIRAALKKMKTEKVLPFRFISAAKHAPALEPELEQCMLSCLESKNKVGGKTVLMIDVSGSMRSGVSSKSDISRVDAACALAILAREVFSDVQVYTFSDSLKHVPARRGFGLRDAIMAQFGGGTRLGHSLEVLNKTQTYDRLIVFTDEQSADPVGQPSNKGYIVNVASYQNGVGYKGKWVHVDGFSEAILDYILAYEALED